MKQELKTIEINGVEYIRADCLEDNNYAMAQNHDGLDYVIIRTYSAGVHAGYLKYREGKEVELINTRRIWYWEGAASLSQLSKDGTAKPDRCSPH